VPGTVWSNTHKLITEYMLDVGSIRGLPANLYSVHVTATGSMQHLIYRSCQRDGSSCERFSDHSSVYNDIRYDTISASDYLRVFEVE